MPILIAFAAVQGLAAESVPEFTHYPVSTVSRVKLIRLDFKSAPKAKRFRSSATKAIGMNANFAGHYILIKQGCGANCIAIALVDVQTGKIYPANFSAALGVSYRTDSRMIIESPPKYINDYYGGTPPDDTSRLFYSTYYEWNEHTKTFVKIYDDYPKPAPHSSSK